MYQSDKCTTHKCKTQTTVHSARQLYLLIHYLIKSVSNHRPDEYKISDYKL